MRLEKFFEFKKKDLEPVTSFRLKDELNPKLWKDNVLDESVAKDLLKIAEDFFDSLEEDIETKDIVLTGSLTNYNWNEKYSDFDIHILIDFKDINDDVELVKKFLDASKTIWNKEHALKVRGYDVEVNIKEKEDKLPHKGIYSLKEGKWLVKPDKFNFKPDEDLISEKGEAIMLLVDDLEKEIDDEYGKFKASVKKVWEKVKKMRQSGLDSDEGEFSTGNLVFKLLRRNGYIGKIVDLKKKAYRKQFESKNETH